MKKTLIESHKGISIYHVEGSVTYQIHPTDNEEWVFTGYTLAEARKLLLALTWLLE